MEPTSTEKALELLSRCDLITLSSIGEDGYPYASVMTKLENDGLSAFYFFASANSRKVQNLLADPRACISYHAPGGSVTLVGDMALESDSAVRERCWRDWLSPAFPGGAQDERLAILRFTPRQATFCFAGKVESHTL